MGVGHSKSVTVESFVWTDAVPDQTQASPMKDEPVEQEATEPLSALPEVEIRPYPAAVWVAVAGESLWHWV